MYYILSYLQNLETRKDVVTMRSTNCVDTLERDYDIYDAFSRERRVCELLYDMQSAIDKYIEYTLRKNKQLNLDTFDCIAVDYSRRKYKVTLVYHHKGYSYAHIETTRNEFVCDTSKSCSIYTKITNIYEDVYAALQCFKQFVGAIKS